MCVYTFLCNPYSLYRSVLRCLIILPCLSSICLKIFVGAAIHQKVLIMNNVVSEYDRPQPDYPSTILT